MTVAREIRRTFNEMSPRERMAAQLLLGKYPTAGLETVAEFARRSGVSGATVLRFVGKLGYAGYSDFQRALREEIDKSLESPISQYDTHRELGPRDSYVQTFVEAQLTNLREMFDNIDTDEFQEVADLLVEPSRSIYFVGGRFTQFLSGYFAWHLRQLRANVHIVEGQPENWAARVADMDRRAVVVVFDFRRYQDNVVNLARAAARRGSTVVLITDTWLSPIASVANTVWCCPIEIPSPYDSALTGLALSECLIGIIVNNGGVKMRARVESIDRLKQEIGPDNL